ncbi:MAG TPA: class I SAM-dependent methyltransferase [Vicinamibacterales bacterium]|nr:class I SAM-dependent methyltransferase [Vicinamibacterales bacterium]
MTRKSAAQSAWDAIGIPFRLALFPQSWLPGLGWTTLEDERIAAVAPHLHGRVLDVGAGTNRLVRLHGDGVGVDVHDWGGGARIVEDAARLPFADASFDSVTFVACLNHIPNRGAALVEARRVIRSGGTLAITMIDPILGGIGHAIWWYGEDRHRGGMKPGEVGGLWPRDVVNLCTRAGFALCRHRRFVYGMNHLFVFETAGVGTSPPRV